MKKFYMIGNTHFDPVWLWKWDEAMASIRATFRSALDRMNEDDSFVYSFATPPVFDWIKRTDPKLFEDIRMRVADGRWELCEAWWVQPDCYAATGESYVRQGLYGQRYLKENFGRTSDTVFNIDSFGHSPMLPQILKKSGVDYYCFVRPEPKHTELEKPLFIWESADGSSVLSYRAEDAYSYEVKEAFDSGREYDELVVFGVTDHGGVPTKAAMADINAEPRAEFSTVSGFFRSHSTDYKVTKELLTPDFGPYANYSRIKYKNRVAEYALLNAEKASLLAGVDERARLTDGWHDVLFNQFHDIIGGACIKDAYVDAENQLGRAIFTSNEIMHYSLQSITKRINTPGRNPDTIWNLVVWNLNSKAFSGYVEAEVQWMHEFPAYDGEIALEDESGVRYECQIIREKSVIPRFRSRFIFKADIPSLGYKTFKVIKLDTPVKKQELTPYVITTDKLKAVFSKEGVLQSVTDIQTGKVVGTNMLVPRVYIDNGDTWCFNIDSYENDAKAFTHRGFQIIESGELLKRIKSVWSFGESRLEIYYSFYKDSPYFDVRYRVMWEEKHTAVKLELDVKADEHLVAVPASSVQRGATDADVPLGAWVSCGDFTVAADSIFAYNLRDKKLGLTLLRSAIYGDLRLSDLDDTIDYDIIDRGIVEGSLRIGFDGATWKMADEVNNPPLVIDESNHSGDLPPKHSFFAISDETVAVTAIKYCEELDGIIVRLTETEGDSKSVAFSLHGTVYPISLAPYEIKTLKIAGDEAVEVNMLELAEDEL